MSVWTITAGATRSMADWGVCKLRRTTVLNGKTGIVKFDLDGANLNSDLPFAQWEPMTIYENGVPWFVGIVTDIPGSAEGQAQSISYEISDPWYWLEETPFQQQFVTANTAGEAVVMETTTQSDVILSQALDAVKINSGDMMREALIYAQYGYQGRDYPTFVGTNHLPPLPDQSQGALSGLVC